MEVASKKAFASLPDLSKAISNLMVLKGVGPATASAILAVYAPDIAPFMSDEVKFIFYISITPEHARCAKQNLLTEMNGVNLKALMAAMGRVKEYTLKQYIPFAEKLQKKAKVQLFYFIDFFAELSFIA